MLKKVRRPRDSLTQLRACRLRSQRPKCSRARSINWWFLSQKSTQPLRSLTQLQRCHHHLKSDIANKRLKRWCRKSIRQLMAHKKLRKFRLQIRFKRKLSPQFKRLRRLSNLKKLKRLRRSSSQLRKWLLHQLRQKKPRQLFLQARKRQQNQKLKPSGMMHQIVLWHPLELVQISCKRRWLQSQTWTRYQYLIRIVSNINSSNQKSKRKLSRLLRMHSKMKASGQKMLNWIKKLLKKLFSRQRSWQRKMLHRSRTGQLKRVSSKSKMHLLERPWTKLERINSKSQEIQCPKLSTN